MNVAGLASLLGSTTLVGKTGAVALDTLAAKKYVLLYFSAHWCPPCRGFTPLLSKCYNRLKESRDDFEIVFVSSDNDEHQFKEYHKDMPWLALPFAERKAKEKLSKKFKVRSIPTLVVLDAALKVVTKKAREIVPEDPEGKKFPWAPRGVYEILAETRITGKDGKQITVDDLKKKEAFALYFSAHWCAPCRSFTPKLVSLYSQLKARKVDTEVIFVSSDRDEQQFTEYYGEMPWATLPMNDPKTQELKEVLEVEGIPTLVTIKGDDGSVINADARGRAAADDDGSKFPWKPTPLPAVADLVPSEHVVQALNERICCILTLNGCANADTPKIEFTEAGRRFNEEINSKIVGDEDLKVQFLICGTVGEQLFGRVQQVLGLQPPKQGQATVMIMNLPNEGAKDVLSGEVTRDSVFELAKRFQDKQKTEE